MLKAFYGRFTAAIFTSRAVAWLVDRIIARAERTPYEHLAGYMDRYWLVKPSRWTLGMGVRVQQILRSDNDRDLHTHPWWNVSLILRGTYWEVMPGQLGEPGVHVGGYVNLSEPFRLAQRKAGDLVFRRARHRHKLMLLRGPVWTMFIHGREQNGGDWGYWVPGVGLVDRREYQRRQSTRSAA